MFNTLYFLVSLSLIILIFFLVEQKQNFPVVIGAIIIISSLPLLKIEGFIVSLAGDLEALFDMALINITFMFWFSFILGLILIGMGIGWRIWAPDSIKKKFSKKDIKKIVKEK